MTDFYKRLARFFLVVCFLIVVTSCAYKGKFPKKGVCGPGKDVCMLSVEFLDHIVEQEAEEKESMIVPDKGEVLLLEKNNKEKCSCNICLRQRTEFQKDKLILIKDSEGNATFVIKK